MHYGKKGKPKTYTIKLLVKMPSGETAVCDMTRCGQVLDIVSGKRYDSPNGYEIAPGDKILGLGVVSRVMIDAK